MSTFLLSDTLYENYRSATLILFLLHRNYLCSICRMVLLAFGWSFSSRLDIFTQSTYFLLASSWCFSSNFGIFTQPACLILASGWGISSIFTNFPKKHLLSKVQRRYQECIKKSCNSNHSFYMWIKEKRICDIEILAVYDTIAD